MTALVRAASLTNFAEVAQELGHDPGAALRRAGLRAQLIREPDQLIEADRVARLLEDAASQTGCESFGLRIAARRQLSNFGMVSLLLMHQPTLRQVLLTLIEHLHLLNEQLAIQVEDVGSMVVLREELAVSVPSRQSIELAIGVLYRMCEALLRDRWQPASVSFAHEPPTDPAFHRRFFKCRIEFDGGFNGLVCRAADLDVPNPGADPVLAAYARKLIAALPDDRQRSIDQEVRKAIYLMLPAGRATCKSVAMGLGMSMRTLQRELDARKLTFKQLINDVRQELARRYVANSRYSLGEVAALLGYSTHSAFTRWFGAQFGCSPEAWRGSRPDPSERRAGRHGKHGKSTAR
ncbi:MULTISPECIES: AraC family transcriptional regulator [unclassified Variovorax]|jgi:AraC-like DNA-binding protein|uniref:AraC family transcriptional regulator n=1 Tax=unclassified Variovorax TaxID=663243 RepID=UPI000F7F5172|nr:MULTISPECIES: AraC family transcriptional regulator [unclassified Variovorax]RSZ40935.1 AraC family transcriptional regulator [Variovorax sp. 553]RSZ42156.1 AraC family transcriptional regulator [Variovorax sp. 679]